MKITTLLAMVLCTAALSQPESFRSMSTGGMIQDDLDRWYSGILYLQPVSERLLEVEGVRVYTGLSNLATGSDMVFQDSDSTRGGFLLGGSWSPAGGVWGIGLLTEFMDDRTFEEISLAGPGGDPFVTGEGTVEGTWSEFMDTNGDGTLDTRQTVHETAAAWTDSSMTSAGLYGGYRVSGTVRLGLGVAWEKVSTEELEADENGSLSVTDSNLVTGVETYSLETTGEGMHTIDRNGLVISASGTGDMTDKLDLGGMFQFAMISADVVHELSFAGTEDFLPGEAAVYDISSWNGLQNISVSPGGNRFGGGLNAEYMIDDIWRMESSAGYYTMSLSGNSDQYSVSMDSTYFLTNGSFIDSTIVSMDGSGSTELDMGDDLFAAGAKLVMDPSDAFTISLGAGFVYHDNSSSVTNSSDHSLVETYSDGDDEFADPDDYVSTSTWSQTEEIISTENVTRISLPVGLEFQVLQGLHARLGASPGFVWEKETETAALLEASPVVTHTVYGDGSEQQVVESPFETVDGTLVETESSYTEIPFSYGVGYSPNPHMQIDLMGLGNSFDQWRLSATLLF